MTLSVADGVGILRIDRPKVNALSIEVQESIRACALEATERQDCRAVVLYGGDRVFAAGADVKEMAQMSHDDMIERSGLLQSAFSAVALIPKPVVAAINGYALGGGCELALCADLRIASTDAFLGQPEILLGIIPGAGGTQRLARLIGPSRAKDLIFSGRTIDAAEALSMGLVDRVVEADQVLPQAVAWAGQFTTAAAVALRAAKYAIDAGLGLEISSGLAVERQEFSALFATEDRRIGSAHSMSTDPARPLRGR